MAGNTDKPVKRPHVHLSRRERQIMDVLYSQGEASVADVQAAIPDAPGYSAMRALLQKLLEKDHVEFREDGPRYLYRPKLQKEKALRNAVSHLVNTFFGGSRADALVNLLGDAGGELDEETIHKLEEELTRLKSRRLPETKPETKTESKSESTKDRRGRN
ncbi:MAG: BlaI/MecI/CopY family transcriptional regulator [Gammaproteobacteria bacterium]|nr:BlaI/MecI/CopY family transcriptional regulator [Gammaproteobacteria bacterium]